MTGTYLAVKNRYFLSSIGTKQAPLPFKALMLLLPLSLYAGAAYNLNQAYKLVVAYKAEQSVLTILENEGVFKGKNDEEVQQITTQISEFLDKEQDEELLTYIRSIR